MTPQFAHDNSTSAVSVVARVVRIVASLLHGLPGHSLWRHWAGFWFLLVVTTEATPFGNALSQMLASLFDDASAVAFTEPDCVVVNAMHELHNGKQTESKSGHVFEVVGVSGTLRSSHDVFLGNRNANGEGPDGGGNRFQAPSLYKINCNNANFAGAING